MRSLVCLIALALAAALALAPSPACGEEDFYDAMPYFLQVTQEERQETVSRDSSILRVYPDTQNDQVDADMRALVDEMAEANRDRLPARAKLADACLDVGPYISRTGTSWMSFLTVARVAADREQLWVDYDARVYDIETGERILLTDVFAPDSPAWALLSQAVREQLTAAFPQEEPDAAALDALCRPESLQDAPFTLGAARLTLTYRADALYPGKNTLLHVVLYYPQIRPHMTPRAQAQTDNSRFRMVALTYDDGGARSYTMNVLSRLRLGAASATFFVVGKNIAQNHDTLCRQQDAGFSVQSHGYYHIYSYDMNVQDAFDWKQRFADELSAVTGVPPTLMRAPGGSDDFYAENGIGYPLIHWSLSSADSGNDAYAHIADRVIYSVEDGDIVLMHDINKGAYRYTQSIVEALNRRGFLCVTVHELFADAGVPLMENQVYYGVDPAVEK